MNAKISIPVLTNSVLQYANDTTNDRAATRGKGGGILNPKLTIIGGEEAELLLSDLSGKFDPDDADSGPAVMGGVLTELYGRIGALHDGTGIWFDSDAAQVLNQAAQDLGLDLNFFSEAPALLVG